MNEQDKVAEQVEVYLWTGNHYGIPTEQWEQFRELAELAGDAPPELVKAVERTIHDFITDSYEYLHDEVIDVPDGKYSHIVEREVSSSVQDPETGEWITMKHTERKRVPNSKYVNIWNSVHRKVARWQSNVRDNLRGPD